MIPTTRTEITPGTASTWVDVDVSAYVDAGNTAGVVLEIVDTSGTEYDWGVRKNGSGDTRVGGIEDAGHTWVAIGIDANDIFECYVANITSVDVFIVGYIKNSEGTFFTNAIDKSLTSTLTWTDINISSDTGADVAKAAFFIATNSHANSRYMGLRENGSTDDHTGYIMGVDLRGAMISVDASEILEGYVTTLEVDFYLVGYLTDNVVSWANAKDYSTGTAGSYQSVDFSSDVPSGNNGAFIHFFPSDGLEYRGNIRKDSGVADSYYDFSIHQYLWTEITSSRTAEQKIEHLNLDLYLWGYTSEPLTGRTTYNARATTNIHAGVMFQTLTGGHGY